MTGMIELSSWQAVNPTLSPARQTKHMSMNRSHLSGRLTALEARLNLHVFPQIQQFLESPVEIVFPKLCGNSVDPCLQVTVNHQ